MHTIWWSVKDYYYCIYSFEYFYLWYTIHTSTIPMHQQHTAFHAIVVCRMLFPTHLPFYLILNTYHLIRKCDVKWYEILLHIYIFLNSISKSLHSKSLQIQTHYTLHSLNKGFFGLLLPLSFCVAYFELVSSFKLLRCEKWLYYLNAVCLYKLCLCGVLVSFTTYCIESTLTTNTVNSIRISLEYIFSNGMLKILYAHKRNR